MTEVVYVYPNQKIMQINKQPCDKNNPYGTINYKSMSEAMQTLCVGSKTAAPFVLWCYLAKNKPNAPFYASNVAFTKFTGLSKKSYDNAMAVLIEKGFLVKKEGRLYEFNELLQQEDPE